MLLLNTIIIGSGISGIFTLKHLLEEGITNVLILDKNSEPFGVWNMKNRPSVFDNTYTVSSKLYMTISDFPIPEKTPEFPHHSLILEYYKNYVKHFNLYSYIKQNCKVISIKKENNIWVITTNEKKYYSLNVVIATGTVNNCPNIPTDEIYKKFTGKIYHSIDYEKIKNIKNKKILIIGGSDTAVDCAMDLKANNKVTISIKNGVWFQNRNAGAYEPADMYYNRILDYTIKNIITKKSVDMFFGNTLIELFWGQKGSGIDIWKSKCDYLNTYYVKSREIIDVIAKGIITPENEIIDINDKTIKFKTDNQNNFDIILFCTGYKPFDCIKFLDNEIVYSKKYKHIFYINDPSLMFIGFIRPYLTSIPMITELQSRWIAKIISKKKSLPSTEYMKNKTIEDDLKQQKEFPCTYERLKTIVDPYDYCNMIADNIDAQINIFKTFITDPKLCYIILFASWNHHVYRLNDNNLEKRNIAIKNIYDNYNHNRTSKKIESGIFPQFIIILIVFIIILYNIIKVILYINQSANIKLPFL
jgi:dimethylaniline monooxygenase (N-oxide forming)